MAITSSTTVANVTLSEVLRDALGPLTPKSVYLPFCNQDNIDGEPTLVAKYPKKTDHGAAVAATEGNDFTTTTALGYDTTVSVTPTEAAVVRSDITTRAARRKQPGETMQAIAARMLAGDFRGLLTMLEDEAKQHQPMLMEKAETDVEALLDDATDTVGSTGVDLTLANLIDAVTALETNDPEHENFVWFWAPQQTKDWRNALLAGTGSSLSQVLDSQVDASGVNFVNDVSRSGAKGSFLGIPIRQLAATTNPLPNAGADVAGALVAVGSGRPGPGAMNGAHVFTEGHAPVVLLDIDPSGRAIEIISIWEYAAAEIRDEHYVSIITDAP